jgi:uronate dehydrogenase
MKILVTGAAGGVGTCFREFAAGKYDLVCFDKVPMQGVPDAVVADLADLEALKKAAQGCDAVLHLGARATDDDFMSVLLPSNVVGTYNVYEAARQAAIKKFVFASTEQVNMGWRKAKSYISPENLRYPTNLYAATKCFGEDLGRMYSSRFGMSVICLRLGWVLVPGRVSQILDRMGGMPDYAVTARDTNEVIARSLEVESIPYAAFNVFSRNAAGFCDLSPLEKVLGYAPQDDAVALWKQGIYQEMNA